MGRFVGKKEKSAGRGPSINWSAKTPRWVFTDFLLCVFGQRSQKKNRQVFWARGLFPIGVLGRLQKMLVAGRGWNIRCSTELTTHRGPGCCSWE